MMNYGRSSEKKTYSEIIGNQYSGRVCVWVAFDPISKLVANYRVDNQELKACRAFIGDLTKQLRNIPLFTSDEMGSYMVALWEAYRTDSMLAWDALPFAERSGAVNPALDYAIFHKTRKNCHVVRTETRVIFGDEARIYERMKGTPSKKINTSFVERFNGTLRLNDAHLHRRSQRFAKNIEYFRSRISIVIAYYNFVRPHSSLTVDDGNAKTKRTPAMHKGLAERPMDLKELLAIPCIATMV